MAQSQTQIAANIIWQNEKRSLLMLEKAFEGVDMEPKVAAVVAQKRAVVAQMEKAKRATRN